MRTSLRRRRSRRTIRTTIVEQRLSEAGDEAVRVVAVGGGPAAAVREADSQKRRVTFVPTLPAADANTRRFAHDEDM
jgi:glycerol dehydrogenase-like iron-containing ADH family enzyme